MNFKALSEFKVYGVFRDDLAGKRIGPMMTLQKAQEYAKRAKVRTGVDHVVAKCEVHWFPVT